MAYAPHTPSDREAMLAAVGVRSVDELFADIPAAVRARTFDLPPPLTEQEVRRELTRLAARNRIAEVTFLGAGADRHLVPAVVMEVIGRSEFATAYTPYQPEVSQGTLQSIYEFQTLVCELTGMEVASASHYDGATATAEAALMACRLTHRDTVAISSAVNPQVRRVLDTYCSGPGIRVIEVPADIAEGGSGLTPIDAAESSLDERVACLVVQQHTRREKAASNICTNQALCAPAATAYLSAVGPEGLREVAELSMVQTRHAVSALEAAGVGQRRFSAPYFAEAAVRIPDAKRRHAALADQGILAGFPLEEAYP